MGAGAQVLGGFTVGDNARIGSNAVVVHEVPADVTVVGVPARKVLENKAEKKAAHENFAAYAVTRGERDPYAQEIERLKAVVAEQTKLISTMASQLGVKTESEKLALTVKSEAEKKTAVRKTAAKSRSAKKVAVAGKGEDVAVSAAPKKAAKPRKKAAKKADA